MSADHSKRHAIHRNVTMLVERTSMMARVESQVENGHLTATSGEVVTAGSECIAHHRKEPAGQRGSEYGASRTRAVLGRSRSRKRRRSAIRREGAGTVRSARCGQ